VRLLFSCDGVFSEDTHAINVTTSVASVVFSKPPSTLPYQSGALRWLVGMFWVFSHIRGLTIKQLYHACFASHLRPHSLHLHWFPPPRVKKTEGPFAGASTISVVQVLDSAGTGVVGKQPTAVYLVDGNGTRVPSSLAAIHINGGTKAIPAISPATGSGGFVGLPLVFSFLTNANDPRMADVRVVVEVDGVMTPLSPKVVPPASNPSAGVCSRLVILTEVSEG
jgi:hypothetical protein